MNQQLLHTSSPVTERWLIGGKDSLTLSSTPDLMIFPKPVTILPSLHFHEVCYSFKPFFGLGDGEFISDIFSVLKVPTERRPS